jgi:hypothetical protein
MFYGCAYDQVFQKYKKLYRIFIQKLKKNVFVCIFGFNNQFIKIMRTMLIFQKKIILFSVNIRNYELIRKTYF